MLILLAVFGAGLVAGFLNVMAGGGSMITLPLLIFLGLPAATANGTNRVAILVQNIAAVGSFQKHGYADFRTGLAYGVTTIPGALVGAFVAVNVGDATFRAILAGVIGIAVLGLLYLIWTLSDAWRLRRMPAIAASTALYRRLYRQGVRLEIPRQPGDTPYELNISLNDHIKALSTRPRWREQVQLARQETQLLVDLYARAIYGQLPPDRGSLRQAVRAWMKLRRRLWLARLLGKVRMR